jgi:hypothetical protein
MEGISEESLATETLYSAPSEKEILAQKKKKDAS